MCQLPGLLLKRLGPRETMSLIDQVLRRAVDIAQGITHSDL